MLIYKDGPRPSNSKLNGDEGDGLTKYDPTRSISITLTIRNPFISAILSDASYSRSVFQFLTRETICRRNISRSSNPEARVPAGA